MPAQASLDLWTLASICLLGAMSPGPSIVVILGVATRGGVRAALLASWTHALGVALWALLTLYGWRLVVTHTPWAAQTISLMGSGYLIYLAYQMWSEAHRGLPQPDHVVHADHNLDVTKKTSIVHDGIAGFVIAISNPKLILFFTAIYTQVLPITPSPQDQVLALVIPTVIDGSWYSFAVVMASRFGLLSFLETHKVKTLYITSILLVFISLHTLNEYLGLW